MILSAQVVLDDSHAAKMTFIDLQRLTSKRNFPQIFVNETFIGGLDELKVKQLVCILSKLSDRTVMDFLGFFPLMVYHSTRLKEL